MEPMPEVTVLMAVYNGEPFLREAIESILHQTYTNFEFLIVDDGSVDGSVSIIESYTDERIRLVRNGRNLGLPKSLNRGLGLARGTFVARQDADDISRPDRLEKQVRFLQDHPGIALVGSAFQEINQEGQVTDLVTLPCEPDEIRWDLHFYCPFVHGVVTAHTSVLKQVGGYSEDFGYAQDYELWTRMAPMHLMANLEEVLVQYRTSPVSMTSTHTAAESDPLRIGMQAVGELAGWGAVPIPDVEARFRQMQRLYLLQEWDDVSPTDARPALATLLRLHDRFCARYGIIGRRRRALRRQLRERLARNVLHVVREARSRRDYALAWKLLLSAGRTSPATLASRAGAQHVAYLLSPR